MERRGRGRDRQYVGDEMDISNQSITKDQNKELQNNATGGSRKYFEIT